jgi:hypothetical protein
MDACWRQKANLAIRLARFGYRSTVIDSSTYEEALSRSSAAAEVRS